ncbi:MAG: sulfatase-like hydrolase/transferase [Bacteroidales bacterium]|nr:sulfatase-like hydrolase/transferase [Bacteroidales bacterium]
MTTNQQHISPTLQQWLRYMGAIVCNLLIAYAVYMLCRIVYVWENWDIFSAGWNNLNLCEVLAGGLRFDTAAIAYTLMPYLGFMLLPLPLAWRMHPVYQKVCKWLFVVANALAIILNLCDAVYSQYTGRRTTSSFFSEFQNDGNLGQILGIELLHHWYLVIIGAVLIALVWMAYRRPKFKLHNSVFKIQYFVLDLLILGIAVTLTIGGMRGGFSKAIRPIANSNANQYVNSPQEAAIVLNTPFSIIRTIGKTTFTDPHYFETAELDSIYSSLHTPTSDAPMLHRNVVVIIVESLAEEYIGYYTPPSHTPFLDSLIGRSLIFDHGYANGRKSIDGMPSILSSIPMFVEPFFVTNYSLNRVSGLAGELSHEGYSTAFFHGAENGSMGFQAFARATGFQHYYGRTEYDNDPRFGGEQDFDGTWAIWDEPFLQFFAHTMSAMPQPFMTAVFTASSHHPFVVPEAYRDRLHVEGHPMHTCIRYVDMALRHFFATAQQQPWYDSTIFVITADHTNISEHDYYLTDIGRYRVPVIFFDPSGTLPTGRLHGSAQQIDIMPTILDALHYNRPYIAYGKNLLDTTHNNTWAVNYNNGIYQYIDGDYLLQHDGNATSSFYNLATDPLMQHNLKDQPDLQTRQSDSERNLKAIIQSYMQRMIGDSLTVNSKNQIPNDARP